MATETRVVELEFRITNEEAAISALRRINDARKKGQTDAEKADAARKREMQALDRLERELTQGLTKKLQIERILTSELDKQNKSLKTQKGLMDQFFSSWRGRMSEFLIVQATLSKIMQGAQAAKAYMDDVIGAGSQQDTATARLNAALANQGQYSEKTAAALDKYASSLQRSIGLADDMTQSIQTQILALTDLPATYLPEATKAVIEISKVTGKDYPSAALQFSKALEGNFQGLAKFGVHIDKTKLKGDDLSKQLQIMRTVVDQLSAGWDIAQAEADTYAGKQKILSEGTGELKERLAALVTHNPAVVTAMDAVGKAIWGVVDGIDAFFKSNPEAMATLMQTIGNSFLTAASGVEKFAYAVSYSAISTQMMAADIRERNAANETNQWTNALQGPAAQNNKQTWREIKEKQYNAYKEYERAKKDRENLGAAYKALTEGHADFQQNITTGRYGINKMKPGDFNWNPQVHGSPGGQPEYDNGAGGSKKTKPKDLHPQERMLALAHAIKATGAGVPGYYNQAFVMNPLAAQIPLALGGGMAGTTWGADSSFRPVNHAFDYISQAISARAGLLPGQMRERRRGRWDTDAALLMQQDAERRARMQAKADRIIGYGGMLLHGDFAGMASQYGQEQGSRLGANWAMKQFGSTGIAGAVGGALGGEAGALLMGGVWRTLKGIGKRLFGGGGHDRGSTPSFPLYTRDVEMGNLLGVMVNLTRMALVRGAGGGLGSLFSQLRIQQTALGVR